MTTPDNYPETPELDRRKEIIDSGATDVLTDFVDWMEQTGYAIVRRCDEPVHENGGYCGVCSNHGYTGPVTDYERLFAEHFGLDEKKIEAELRRVLAHQRSLNDG